MSDLLGGTGHPRPYPTGCPVFNLGACEVRGKILITLGVIPDLIEEPPYYHIEEFSWQLSMLSCWKSRSRDT